MTISERDGHTIVTADEGNYVGFEDKSVFGAELSLGKHTTPDMIVEHPIEWWPQPEPEPENEPEPEPKTTTKRKSRNK